MSFVQIALSGLRRRKAKTLLVMLGLATVLASNVSAYSGLEAMKTETNRQTADYGANILMTANTGELAFLHGSISIPSVLVDVEHLTMSHLKQAQKLVAFAESKIGCGFLFGDNGKPITEELIQAKARQYPKKYSSSYIRRSRKWIGSIDEQGNLLPGFDCSGLIDVFLGVDLNAKGYYAKATAMGEIGSFPATIPGVLLFKAGRDGIINHVGISDGKGSVIEAKGVDYGVVKMDLGGSGWDYWGYCHLLDYSDVTDTTPDVVPGIRYGDKGTRVTWLQTALNIKGYGLKVDSIFGQATLAALQLFQEKNGLKVDGICGPKTTSKLVE